MQQRKTTKRKLTAQQQLTIAGNLIGRLQFAQQLGLQYGTDRDLYEALGYQTTIKYNDYLTRYLRQDIAKAIIDRPVQATWRGIVNLIEPDEDEDTEFERAWTELERKLGIKSMFARLDKLTGIGSYGVLLLGLSDVQQTEDFKKKIDGIPELIYIKAFGEGSATIKTYESDPQSERYGLPLTYDLKVADVSGGAEKIIEVHNSRVIHVVMDTLESDVKGIPRLECVFNRLMDIEKIVGGDAEMFWRGARPGYVGKVDPNYKMTDEAKEDLQDEINEYEHKLRRILVNEGVDFNALAQQIADPSAHYDIQLKALSAVLGIPKRILEGSERGELASSQDTNEWLSYIQGRREEYIEPCIIRPFADRCIELGILPEVDRYEIEWQDLFSMSEKERVDIGQKRALALQSYANSPMIEEIMPAKAFREYCLGLTDEDSEYIDELAQAEIAEEERNIIPEEEHIEEQVPEQVPENVQ